MCHVIWPLLLQIYQMQVFVFRAHNIRGDDPLVNKTAPKTTFSFLTAIMMSLKDEAGCLSLLSMSLPSRRYLKEPNSDNIASDSREPVEVRGRPQQDSRRMRMRKEKRELRALDSRSRNNRHELTGQDADPFVFGQWWLGWKKMMSSCSYHLLHQ